MYLWDAFAAAARTVLPQAAIVHDKYHLERLNQRAIDLTRRQELPEIPELKGERFWLLRSSATRPPEHQAFFDAIHQSSSTTARTWQAAEDFRAVYKFETSFDARSYLLNWVNKYCITPIRPLRRLVETFERARQGIVNFFDHPITNALAERMNGKIQEIKLLAKGFRTFEHFKIAVLFYWGGLELYPLKSQ
jgi:transposase